MSFLDDEHPHEAIVWHVLEGERSVQALTAGRAIVVDHPRRAAIGDVVQYVITAFECRLLGGDMRPDGDEVLAARYVAAEELADLPLSNWATSVLPELMRRRAAWVPPVTWRPARAGR